MMHVHAPSAANQKRTQFVLRISLLLTLGYVALTFVAGLRSNSLALISEAGHNLSDFLALLLSIFAVHIQGRAADENRTYGYLRAEVLAAFVNASTLLAIALWIAIAAVHRLAMPVVVQPRLMMMVAAVGVAMNGVISLLLWRVAHDMNIKSAFLHMAGDTLSTMAVIAGGLLIRLTGQVWIDPALSLLIAALIFWSSIGIVRDTMHILLEGTPRGLSIERLRTRMLTIQGVLEVHDLHAWSLGSNSHALSCHVTIADIPPSESMEILQALNSLLQDEFHIMHTTIQFENYTCVDKDGCAMPFEAFVATHTHYGHHPHMH